MWTSGAASLRDGCDGQDSVLSADFPLVQKNLLIHGCERAQPHHGDMTVEYLRLYTKKENVVEGRLQ
jgi:hypothetical protein